MQVVDKVNDDAWGLSAALPVGVEPRSLNPDESSSAVAKLALVVGLSAGGEERRTRRSGAGASCVKYMRVLYLSFVRNGEHR